MNVDYQPGQALELRGVKAVHETKRAYDAWFDYQYARIERTSLATMRTNGTWPNICPLMLVPSLIHRRVWCFFFCDSAAANTVDADLVFFLDKTEVFRQKFVQWESTGATGQNWTLGMSWTPGSQDGIYGGAIQTVVPSAPLATWNIVPWNLNIQADSCAIQPVNTTGAGAIFDAILQVGSFAGI